MKLVYSYSTSGTTQKRCRVASVTEYAADDTTGNILVLNYSLQNSTTFTYVKNSGEISETYQFNDWGHTTCVLGEDGSTANIRYNTFSGSNSTSVQLATNNKITQVSAGTRYINNMLLNHNAETGVSSWNTSMWTETNAEFLVDTAESYLGYNSFKVHQNDSKPQRCGWCHSVNVTGGKTYTFSAYVKTKGITPNGTNGATLYGVAFNGSTELEQLECETQLTGDKDWQRVSMTFTVPAETDRLQVYGGLRYVNGTAWFDCFQMEENDTVSPYNLIENSNFSGLSGWSKSNAASTDGITEGIMRITGSPTIQKNAYQCININKTGTAVHMRASAKATAAPNMENTDCYIGIDVGIFYEDGTRDWSYTPFNSDVSEWQTISFTAAPQKGNENKKIRYIAVYVLYYKQVNTAYFDDIMVTIDETGTTYSYDNDGNLITSIDNAKHQTTYTINNATDMITSLKDSTNTVYSYTYDSVNKKQLKSAKETSTGIGFEYTYGTGNNKGNVETVRLGMVGSMTAGKYIESSTEYTDKRRLCKSADGSAGI